MSDARNVKQIQKEISQKKIEIENLQNQIKEMESRPEPKEIEALINETALLAQGETNIMHIEALDLYLEYRLSWQNDRYADVSLIGFMYQNSVTKKLIDTLNDMLDIMNEDLGLKYKIEKTKEYRSFNKRIQAVCKKSDALEKKYPDTYDWERDVLDVAEGRVG